MNARLAAVIAAALIFGFVIGHRTGAREQPPALAPVQSPTAPMPPDHPPVVENSPVDSAAIAGLRFLQEGRYAEAAAVLGDLPKSGTTLHIFEAIALEGAGKTSAAEKLLKTGADIEELRSIGRQAFMEHQDIAIAGPAYQLFLRLRPNTENKPMMENAVRAWKESGR